MFSSKLPSSPGTAPALFSSFSPYPDDRSGVSLTSGFVDFATGRNSIVTTPQLRRPDAGQGVRLHAHGANRRQDPRGDERLSSAWGPGADRVVHVLRHRLSGRRVVGHRLADRIDRRRRADRRRPVDRARRRESLFERLGAPRRPGDVSAQRDGARPIVNFTEAASFAPFSGSAGVSVATTSTTTGADLLVSGVSAEDKTVQVLKYNFVRPSADAVMLQAKEIGKVISAAGSLPDGTGGD